ncbi:hypothetical protein [Shewanella livingstonensis]|uniref:hypothetical protein n=1 Tax=Shewanella livingstonensis TaxID=150120 RepID=UPI0013E384CF|nr:hypothetical protein [Shewanella livingstonensis]
MNKVTIKNRIQSINTMVSNAIAQGRHNIFFFAHIGYSQWDEVETRSGKHR